MWKNLVAIMSVSVLASGLIGNAVAYEIVEVVNGSTITGQVSFVGTPPASKRFAVKRGPEVCGKERTLTKVRVKDGALQGAVLVLEGVQQGKPFEAKQFQGTSPNEGAFLYGAGEHLDLAVQVKKCNFGPFTGVVAVDQPVRFLNHDPIKHILHTYVLKGRKATILKTVHNQNLPAESETIQLFHRKKMKKARAVAMTCDRHEFMENWLYVVDTPYFAISDENGRFAIDRIPPGHYHLIAWHPVLGTQEQEITVSDGEHLSAAFEFAKP